MRIVLVEDSPRVVEVVSAALTSAGHTVRVATTLANARSTCHDAPFDVAIVDVGLPDGSGLDLCRSLRKEGNTRPILLLTARNDVRDRVDGLDAGADDYLAKPFSIAELNARIRALGRRGERFIESARSYGALSIDRDRRIVAYDGQTIPLTAREFDIVALLAWRDGRIVPRDEILEVFWGEVSQKSGASLDVLVTRIRRKLAERIDAEVIRTARLVGYAWALERSKQG